MNWLRIDRKDEVTVENSPKTLIQCVAAAKEAKIVLEMIIHRNENNTATMI